MSDTELIKDKIDVVDLVGEYVQLKPAGATHKGLCPFHQEKTPSFIVSRERQRWHCFGCGKGGDIFTFVEEMEGMEFVETLKYLANRAGVQLSQSTRNDMQSNEKNRIKEVNAEAARFFHSFLTRMDASVPAREYLKKRGLLSETIETWSIGYIPDQWDLLTKYLLQKGHSIDDLVAAGLTIKREGATQTNGKGYYDRFRGRVMFPIRDIHGSVIGFTGRVLVETEKSGGKYVNTPQTSVYDKSRVVFGLYEAKKEIKAKNVIVMVEGQMDVIACHEAGMTNVAASSGTALSEEQVKLLKRYADRMTMAFDADVAGQKAAKRGIQVAIAQGMGVKVIHIPEGGGKDPDECIRKDKAVWFAAVEQAEDVMRWYFRSAFDGKDIQDPKQKQQIVNMLLPDIRLIPYAVERDHWLSELSTRLRVDVSILREDMKRIAEEEKVKRPDVSPVQKAPSAVELTRLERLFESWLVIFLRFPKDIPFIGFSAPDMGLSTSGMIDLYKAMEDQYTTDGHIDIETLRKNAHVSELLDTLVMKGELTFSGIPLENAKQESEQLAAQIREDIMKQKRQRLAEVIEQAEKAGDHERLQTLLQQLQQIHL